MNEAIAEMKQYCLDHYEEGGSWLVECWGKDEWDKLRRDCDDNVQDMWNIVKGLVIYFHTEEINAKIESGVNC
jgi:hypothetical protein